VDTSDFKEGTVAPESPSRLVVLDLAYEIDRLAATRYLVDSGQRFLVKWYGIAAPPVDYQAVAGGVVFVPSTVKVHPPELRVEIRSASGFYQYNDWADMLVLILPQGRAMSFQDPKPRHAKDFEGRVAVYWLAPKDLDNVEAFWGLPYAKKDAETVTQEIEEFLSEARSQVPTYTIDDYSYYDFALSYASEDREHAQRIASALLQAKKRVFFDHHDRPRLLGRELDQELDTIFSKRSMFCVVFVSKHYAAKEWTRKELAAALKSRGKKDHIIPIQLDDTKLEQLPQNVAYVPTGTPVNDICTDLLEKLRRV
jgi:hypothetical protein